MSLAPLETPVLKVSRPVAACSRCRNAKIKCDGKLPACTSCEKNGRAAECTSTNDQFARGKERSYVSTLETRIEKLQARIEEAKARKPSVVSIPDDEMTAQSQSHTPQAIQEPPTPNTSRNQKRREVTAIDDLVSNLGFLSVNATTRDFHGFTSSMSYARLILSACSKDALPEGTTTALPPRYDSVGLINFYFDTIFALLPAFDEASFYASLDSVDRDNSAQAQPFDHFIVRMVLAIASVSISEQHGDQRYVDGIGHVCTALEHAESVLQPGNISNVQALVLLTEYAMLDPHHFDSWTLIGAASRAMTDLGLHNDPPKGTVMAKGKLELRRRVYHCVYALDRATSLVQTRAFSFSDESANVKVPYRRQPASMPSSPIAEDSAPKPWRQSYELAADMIKLRQLQSSWYMDLFQSGRNRYDDPYTYLWNTCDALRSWFEKLTPTISSRMRAFFELELLYSYIYVLSPSHRIPVIVPFAQKLIFEYCIHYTDLMLRLISDSGHVVPVTFYDAMRVYMTGRQFLSVLQQNTDFLLTGHMPPHPEVKPTAAPPPPMPAIPLAPGDTVLRTNTLRSIDCLRKTTECLSRFGNRWGYMSWNERFRDESSRMLEDLTLRLRQLDESSGIRRQSVWQGSVGSIASSNGSISYTSPQSVHTNRNSYQQSPPQEYNASNCNDAGVPLQPIANGSQFVGQPHYFPAQPPPMQQVQPPPFQYQPPTQYPAGHSFDFNETPFQQSRPLPNTQNQLFGSWGGYGGASASNPLDEEPEVPPHSNPWDYTKKGSKKTVPAYLIVDPSIKGLSALQRAEASVPGRSHSLPRMYRYGPATTIPTVKEADESICATPRPLVCPLDFSSRTMPTQPRRRRFTMADAEYRFWTLPSSPLQLRPAFASPLQNFSQASAVSTQHSAVSTQYANELATSSRPSSKRDKAKQPRRPTQDTNEPATSSGPSSKRNKGKQPWQPAQDANEPVTFSGPSTRRKKGKQPRRPTQDANEPATSPEPSSKRDKGKQPWRPTQGSSSLGLGKGKQKR